MRLFGRKRPASPPDPELPLSTSDAVRLRRLVRTSFAEAGREVVVYAAHVEDDSGARFGLWNLAALCQGQPAADWPRLVRDHVRLLVVPSPSLDDLSDADLRAAVHLRLVEAGGVSDPTWHPSARRLGADLLAVLSIDLPETVATPPERDWERRGGLAHWQEVGTANLRALLVSDDLVHERVRPDPRGGEFDLVTGDSFFVGSLSLLVPEVVQRFTPGLDLRRGVLVAAPFRHQLAWRVVDGRDAALALDHLSRFAPAGFADAPGPLSPHVHWVCDGVWQQVTRLVDDRPEIVLSPELAAALGADPDA